MGGWKLRGAGGATMQVRRASSLGAQNFKKYNQVALVQVKVIHLFGPFFIKQN